MALFHLHAEEGSVAPAFAVWHDTEAERCAAPGPARPSFGGPPQLGATAGSIASTSPPRLYPAKADCARFYNSATDKMQQIVCPLMPMVSRFMSSMMVAGKISRCAARVACGTAQRVRKSRHVIKQHNSTAKC